MASSPAFASTPSLGSASLGGFDTSLTAPSTVSTIVTGGSSGTKINEIVIQGTGTTVAGVVNIFVYDGSYSLIDQVLVSAVTSSTTAVAFRAVRQYANLVLPSSSWTLRATHTVTGNDTNKLRVSAFGGNI